MAESQRHGIEFEDIKIKEITGISKKEYDNLKQNGYTCPYDLVEGVIVDYNASIKTTKSNSICCSDILKRMEQKEYQFIIGVYKQAAEEKIFHTEYTFYITEEDYDKLWGSMKYEDIKSYVDFVKSIPPGKEAQQQFRKKVHSLKKELKCKDALMAINPKVDSKKQRRVQCSTKLDKLLSSGIKYEKKDISISIQSSKRKFNK